MRTSRRARRRVGAFVRPGGRAPDRGPASVASGAVALGAAGLVAKGLSAVSRVVIASWLGAEAVGLYEMAAPVLATGISICGLGLPVASAALIAAARGRGDRQGVARLLRAIRLLLFASGLTGGVLVEVFAHPLAELFGNTSAAGPLRAIGPAIVLASLLNGEKSWLQGSGRVAVSAAALIAEQLARVAAAVWAAASFAGAAAHLAPLAATWVAVSPAVGGAAGLLACVAIDRAAPPAAVGGGGPQPPPSEGTGRQLRAGGLPNWISGIISSLSTTIDVPLITWRLRAAGLDGYAATAALGELNGMAMPLGAGPAVLFGAVGSALIPAAAADWAQGHRQALRRRGDAAYFWVLAMAAPCAVALWQLAEPLCLVLYRNTAAAVPLGVLAWVGLPLGVTYVASALANAVGRPAAVLPGACAAAVVKSACVLAFTSGAGIRGAAWGQLAGFAVSALLNVRSVQALTGSRPPWWAWAAVTAPAIGLQLLAGQVVWWAVPDGRLALRVAATLAFGAAAYAAGFVCVWRLAGRRLGLPDRWPWGSARRL